MNIKVAIVILNWNGKKYLEKFLPSVLKHLTLPSVKVIIADNNSSDDSVEFVKTKYPEVQLILFDRNHGFARGYALALPQINAEYYVLLNSDVEVTEQWLEPLVQLMDNDTSIAAVMPKIRSFNRREYFEYAGAPERTLQRDEVY